MVKEINRLSYFKFIIYIKHYTLYIFINFNHKYLTFSLKNIPNFLELSWQRSDLVHMQIALYGI